MPKTLNDLFEEQSLRVLYRKMHKTARARFNCAHRLRLFHTFTLWTMSGFSTGLIILAALSTYKIPIAVDPSIYGFLQFCLSLAILVISILLSSGNHSDRSEKMHRCALEINALCHNILPACKENKDNQLYEDTLAKYLNILAAYENHLQIDFDLVKFDFPEDYTFTRWERNQVYIRYASRFWVHIMLLLILLSVFAYVIMKKG